MCMCVFVCVRVCVCVCVCVGDAKCGAGVRVEWSVEEGFKLFIHSDHSPSLNLPEKPVLWESMSVKILSPVRTHFLFKAFYTSPLLYFTEQWLLSSTFHQESCRILGKLSWPGTRPAARRSTPLLLLLPFKANTPGPYELEILAFLAGSKLSGSQWWSPSLCKL